MIANAIDSLVSVFSPSAAIRRKAARAVYDRMLQRGYDAANSTRLNQGIRVANSSADLELQGRADAIRASVREIIRNNAYARGVQKAIGRNVVGCGIRPQSRVELGNGKPNERFNAAAEKLWSKWQQQADVTGRLSFYEMQRLALDEVGEAGECLVKFVRSDDPSRPLPFALELIEADRIASDRDTEFFRQRNGDNEIRRGVEVDAKGRPVAYWLYDRNPNDLNASSWASRRHSAEQFIHLYKQERIGQTRGVSWFAPITRWTHGLHRYVDHEMVAAEVASCFSVAIKTIDGSGALGTPETNTDTEDADGNEFSHLQAGLVARLLPDEEVQVINPGRSHGESKEWINLMLRSMAVGVGLSYERLTRDYSQTNYSSNRASDLEDRREFRPLQDWLIQRLCIPVWERFLFAASNAGADGFPGAFDLLSRFDRMSAHVWQAPGWEWVDPQKEATASIDAIDNNLSTLADELAKRGNHDWRDVLKQRAMEKAEEQRLNEEFGIVQVAQETADSSDVEEEDTEAETDAD